MGPGTPPTLQLMTKHAKWVLDRIKFKITSVFELHLGAIRQSHGKVYCYLQGLWDSGGFCLGGGSNEPHCWNRVKDIQSSICFWTPSGHTHTSSKPQWTRRTGWRSLITPSTCADPGRPSTLQPEYASKSNSFHTRAGWIVHGLWCNGRIWPNVVYFST